MRAQEEVVQKRLIKIHLDRDYPKGTLICVDAATLAITVEAPSVVELDRHPNIRDTLWKAMQRVAKLSEIPPGDLPLLEAARNSLPAHEAIAYATLEPTIGSHGSRLYYFMALGDKFGYWRMNHDSTTTKIRRVE